MPPLSFDKQVPPAVLRPVPGCDPPMGDASAAVLADRCTGLRRQRHGLARPRRGLRAGVR